MLRTALKFIESELNNFMVLRDGNSYSSPPALLCSLVKRDGSVQSDPGNIYISLTHLEEERLENKKPVYRPNTLTGRLQVFQPPVHINAYVLFSAVQADYPTALRDLSLVATYFQHYNVFRADQYPNLNAGAADTIQKPWQHIEELTAQMYTVTYEQQSYIWSCMGAKYVPSLLYKFRLLVVFDQDTEKEASPILEGVSHENPI